MSTQDRQDLYFNIEWYAAQIGCRNMIRPIHTYSDSDLIYYERILREKAENHG
jgi:hypothetical protein